DHNRNPQRTLDCTLYTIKGIWGVSNRDNQQPCSSRVSKIFRGPKPTMILLLEQNTARVEHSGRKTYLEGIFLPVGNQPTANKRLYTTEHLNDLVSDLQPTIKEGGLVGE